MKLHVGCGLRILEGWVNRDLHRPPEGTKPFDALRPWPYERLSAVYCEDLVEHFSQPDQYRFFAEAARALRRGGVLRINCPDALWSIKNWIIKGDVLKEGMKALDCRAEPYQEGHQFLPTVGYLLAVLPLFGFRSVVALRRDESGIPGFPGDSRPRPDTPVRVRGPEGNLFVEATK